LLDGTPEQTRIGAGAHEKKGVVEDVELRVRQIERRRRIVAQIVEASVLRDSHDLVLKPVSPAVAEADGPANWIELRKVPFHERFAHDGHSTREDSIRLRKISAADEGSTHHSEIAWRH